MTLREALGVCAAFNANQRRDMQLVATLGSYIANFGGFGTDDTVHPSDLIPNAFSDTAGQPTREWLEHHYELYRERHGLTEEDEGADDSDEQ